MTKHAPATPLPWHMGVKQAERIIYDATGWAIANATVYHGRADEHDTRGNAAYIVHACNAYPGLVEDRRRLVEALRGLVAERNAIAAELASHTGITMTDHGERERTYALLRELGE